MANPFGAFPDFGYSASPWFVLPIEAARAAHAFNCWNRLRKEAWLRTEHGGSRAVHVIQPRCKFFPVFAFVCVCMCFFFLLLFSNFSQ